MSGRQDDVEKYFEIFSKNETMIGDPNSLSNIIYMLNRKYEKGDKHANEMAIKLAKDYWEIKPANCKVLATLYINLSISFISVNSNDTTFESIINEARHIFKENPKYFSPYEGTMYGNIACYYGILNDKKNAYKYLRKAKETNDKNFISFNLNKVFKAWQKDDEFKKIFSDFESKDVDESNPFDSFQKVLELHENGKNDEALLYYEKALQINPKHEETLLNISNIYFDRNEWDKVFQFYNKVIELSPNFLLGYTNRGEAYLLNNKYTEAIELRSDYDYPFFMRRCSYYYINDHDNAKNDFLRGVQLNPDYEKIHGHNEWFSIIKKVLEL